VLNREDVGVKRLTLILTIALVCGIPAAAQANYSKEPPHLSCGEIDGAFSDFPAGPQTVVLHTSVDGVPQPDQSITANGPNFTTSTGYWNPDGGAHVVQGWFSWTTSTGETGRGPLQTTTITNCPLPAPMVTVVQQQGGGPTTVLPGTTNANGTAPSNASGRAPTTTGQGGVGGEDISQFVCTSQRRYTFLVRPALEGQAVVGIDRVLVRGVERYGSVKKVTVRGKTRFRVTADYRNLTVPRGQLRTITTFVKLADGRKVRTVQFLRLCLDQDGNPNDTPTQDRAAR
jgi:hypothetical protein